MRFWTQMHYTNTLSVISQGLFSKWLWLQNDYKNSDRSMARTPQDLNITWHVWLTTHDVHFNGLHQTGRSTTHRLDTADSCFCDSLTVGIFLTGQSLMVNISIPVVTIIIYYQWGLGEDSCVNVSTAPESNCHWYLVKICWYHHVPHGCIPKGNQFTDHLQKWKKWSFVYVLLKYHIKIIKIDWYNKSHI